MYVALPSSRAPGADSIPAEIYKEGGDEVIRRLLQLYVKIWEDGEVPQDFKDALIVHIYKRKGDRACCDNHRGISLLSIEREREIYLHEKTAGNQKGKCPSTLVPILNQIINN